MRDVVMLAVITAFFILCLAYVRWCDRIIGPDPVDASDDLATADRGATDLEESRA